MINYKYVMYFIYDIVNIIIDLSRKFITFFNKIIKMGAYKYKPTYNYIYIKKLIYTSYHENKILLF